MIKASPEAHAIFVWQAIQQQFPQLCDSVWPVQRRRWPVCGCPPALWHPQTGFEQLVLQLQEKVTVSQHIQYRAKGLMSSFSGSVSSKSLSSERNLVFSKTDGPALLTALSKLMHHWIWFLSFVFSPFFLPYSPLEMGQEMSRSQNKQNLLKFKLRHKISLPYGVTNQYWYVFSIAHPICLHCLLARQK